MRNAKQYRETEDFEAMVREMKAVAEFSDVIKPMLESEWYYFSLAYKKLYEEKKSRLEELKVVIEHDQKKGKTTDAAGEAAKLRIEIHDLCDEVIGLVDGNLLQSAEKNEAKVLFGKMKGDFTRYMLDGITFDGSNYAVGDELTKKCEDAYRKALDIAENELHSTNPIRLGLALNYSVFVNEVKGNPAAACEVAKSAFDEAMLKLTDIRETDYKYSTELMQTMKDNLALWKTEME